MFDLLRGATVRRIWLTELLNSFGAALTFWGLAWLLLRRAPADAWLAGATLGALSGAGLLGTLWLGTYLDRWDRRRVLVLCNGLVGSCTALMPLASAQLPALLGVVALAGLAGSLLLPTWQAVLPGLAPPPRQPAVQALFNSTWMLSGLAAPAAAGLLVARFGPATALYLDAATSFMAAWSYLGLRLPAAPPRQPGAERRSAGWRHVLARPPLWGLFLGLGAVNGFMEPLNALLLPRAAERWFAGRGGLGLDQPAALGVGFLDSVVVAAELLGNVWLARVTISARGQWRLLVLGQVLPVVLGAAILFSPNLSVALVLAALQGLAFAPLGVLVGVVVARLVPPEVLGRVSGARTFLASAPRPLGSLGAGLLLPALGLGATTWLLAGLALALIGVGRTRRGEISPSP